MPTLRMRLTSLSLVVAGVCFALYPAIRPFSDKASIQGAKAFASLQWLLSHSLAMVGFILLILGLLGLSGLLRETTAGNLCITALIVTWIGIGFTLPYYGAEAFSLRAAGQEALRQDSVGLLVTLTNSIRFGEGIWFFLFGLIALALGIILFSIAIWRSGVLIRWSGIPLAFGFALFIPQFFTPQPVRVAYGLLVLVGCWLVAWSVQKEQMSAGDGTPGPARIERQIG
jgi:hypothetical protein